MPRSFLITNRRYKVGSLGVDNKTSQPGPIQMDSMTPIVVPAVRPSLIEQPLQPLHRHVPLTSPLTSPSFPMSPVLSASPPLHPSVQMGLRSPIFIRDSDLMRKTSLFSHYLMAERNEDLAAFFSPSGLRSVEDPDLEPTCSPELDRLEFTLKDVVEKAWSELEASGAECHVCPECGKRYSTSSNLARHRQTHRSMHDKKARKCPHCEKVYVSMPAYSMHVRTHNQGCECSHCGKRFSRPWLLQGHIRTHTGEKPFTCSQCGKAFADKSNLRAHIQTHSTEKPFVCGRCGKAFALKSYLYKHEESSCMRGQRYHRNH